MILLVCGGRDYNDRQTVYYHLDKIHNHKPITLVLHGAATGADSLAEEWAKQRQIAYTGVPAKWGQLGKAAGPSRNARMLHEFHPDGVCAFPGNTGTQNMITLADDAGLKVYEVKHG